MHKIDHLRLERLPTPLGLTFLVTDPAGRIRAFEFEDYEERMTRLLGCIMARSNYARGRHRRR